MRRVADDFDQNYVIDPDSGCWLWMRAYDGRGRGMLRWGDHNLGAHVVAWILKHGTPPPAGTVLISRCRVIKCCNPDHYYVGTRGEAWHAGNRSEQWLRTQSDSAVGQRHILATGGHATKDQSAPPTSAIERRIASA